MSVRLIFSFDSEDYETPAADDAEKWWAETMTKHGITACLCVVGELALNAGSGKLRRFIPLAQTARM